ELTTILTAWSNDVFAPVGRTPFFPENQRTQFDESLNATAAEYPADTPLGMLIEQQVARTPNAVAVTGNESLTYRELNARANRLANALIKLGVGPDSLVGVCLERSVDLVVALVAVVKSGGAYVPLDPGFPRERLGFMARDAALPVLLTEPQFQDSIAE